MRVPEVPSPLSSGSWRSVAIAGIFACACSTVVPPAVPSVPPAGTSWEDPETLLELSQEPGRGAELAEILKLTTAESYDQFATRGLRTTLPAAADGQRGATAVHVGLLSGHGGSRYAAVLVADAARGVARPSVILALGDSDPILLDPSTALVFGSAATPMPLNDPLTALAAWQLATPDPGPSPQSLQSSRTCPGNRRLDFTCVARELTAWPNADCRQSFVAVARELYYGQPSTNALASVWEAAPGENLWSCIAPVATALADCSSGLPDEVCDDADPCDGAEVCDWEFPFLSAPRCRTACNLGLLPDDKCPATSFSSCEATPAVPAPCGVSNIGECRLGQKLCAADGGSCSVCTGAVFPSAELCNGLDDDCNGVTDDALDTPRACVSPICSRVGTTECRQGAWTACVPVDFHACVCRPGENAPFYDGPPATSGVGTCRDGLRACASDGTAWNVQLDEKVPTPEICNGLDDDCDGIVDNADGGGQPLTMPYYDAPDATLNVGACRPGLFTCGGGGAPLGSWGITKTSITPLPELCNGMDDDCDGITDNYPDGGLLLQPFYDGPVGTAGFGICRAGQQICGGINGWLPCPPPGPGVACQQEVTPRPEQCEGQDLNCDGLINDPDGGCGAFSLDGGYTATAPRIRILPLSIPPLVPDGGACAPELSGEPLDGGNGPLCQLPIVRQDGPVLHGDQSGTVPVHLIWYGYPGWEADGGNSETLQRFVNELSGSSYLKILASYEDLNGSAATLLRPDTVVLAADAGCPQGTATDGGVVLSDDDIFGIVQCAGFANDSTGISIVVTAPGVGETSSAGSFCEAGGFCGWHTARAGAGGTNVLFGFIGDSTGRNCCQWTGESPPHGAVTEFLASEIAALLADTITNPDTVGGYSVPNCQTSEVGDLCANRSCHVQPGAYSVTRQENWLLQDLWLNTPDGGCANSYNPSAAPRFLPFGRQLGRVGSDLKFNIPIDNPAGYPLSWSYSWLPGTAPARGSTPAIAGGLLDLGVPPCGDEGDHFMTDVAVTYAVDGGVVAVVDPANVDIGITSNPGYCPPHFFADGGGILNLSIGDTEGQAGSFVLNAMDAIGEPLIYSVASPPQSSTGAATGWEFAPEERTFSWRPDYQAGGTAPAFNVSTAYNAQISACEVGTGRSLCAPPLLLTLNVADSPRGPEIDPIVPPPPTPEETLLSFRARVTDVDPTETIAVSRTDGGAPLPPLIWDEGCASDPPPPPPDDNTLHCCSLTDSPPPDGGWWVCQWLPAWSVASLRQTVSLDFDLDFALTRDAGVSTLAPVHLVVIDNDRPPLLFLQPDASDVEAGQPVVIEVGSSDPDGDPLTYEVTVDPADLGPPPQLLENGPDVTLVWTADPPSVRPTGIDVTFSVTASDGQLSSPKRTAQIHIAPAPVPPRLVVPSAVSVMEGQALELKLQVTAPSGGALRLSASGFPGDAPSFACGLLAWPAASCDGSPPWVAPAGSAGDYGVLFTLSDGQDGGPGGTATMELQVLPVAGAPVGSNPPDVVVVENDAVSITFVARDPGGRPIVFAPATPLPAGGALEPETGLFTWRPSSHQLGEQTVSVAASNGQQKTVLQVRVHVQPLIRFLPHLACGSTGTASCWALLVFAGACLRMRRRRQGDARRPLPLRAVAPGLALAVLFCGTAVRAASSTDDATEELSVLSRLSQIDPRMERAPAVTLHMAEMYYVEALTNAGGDESQQASFYGRSLAELKIYIGRYPSSPDLALVHLKAAEIESALDPVDLSTPKAKEAHRRHLAELQKHLDAARELVPWGSVRDMADFWLVDRSILRDGLTLDSAATAEPILKRLALQGETSETRALALTRLASVAEVQENFDACISIGDQFLAILAKDPRVNQRPDDELQAVIRCHVHNAHRDTTAEGASALARFLLHLRDVGVDLEAAAETAADEFDRLGGQVQAASMYESLAGTVADHSVSTRFEARRLSNLGVAADLSRLRTALSGLTPETLGKSPVPADVDALLGAIREIWQAQAEDRFSTPQESQVAEAALDALVRVAPGANLTWATRLAHGMTLRKVNHQAEGIAVCKAVAEDKAAPVSIRLDAAECALSEINEEARCADLTGLRNAVEVTRQSHAEKGLRKALETYASCLASASDYTKALEVVHEWLDIPRLPAEDHEQALFLQRRFELARAINTAAKLTPLQSADSLAAAIARAGDDHRLCDLRFEASYSEGILRRDSGQIERAVTPFEEARRVSADCPLAAQTFGSERLADRLFELAVQLGWADLSIGALDEIPGLLEEYSAESRHLSPGRRRNVAELLVSAGAVPQALRVLEAVRTDADDDLVVEILRFLTRHRELSLDPIRAFVRGRYPRTVPVAVQQALAQLERTHGHPDAALSLRRRLLEDKARGLPLEVMTVRAQAAFDADVEPLLAELPDPALLDGHLVLTVVTGTFQRTTAALKKLEPALQGAIAAATEAGVGAALSLRVARALRRIMLARLVVANALRNIEPPPGYSSSQLSLLRAELESRAIQPNEAAADALGLKAAEVLAGASGLVHSPQAPANVLSDAWAWPGLPDLWGTP